MRRRLPGRVGPRSRRPGGSEEEVGEGERMERRSGGGGGEFDPGGGGGGGEGRRRRRGGIGIGVAFDGDGGAGGADAAVVHLQHLLQPLQQAGSEGLSISTNHFSVSIRCGECTCAFYVGY